MHTTASLPHFTVPTGARLTRNIAQSSAVGALCVRLHGGVWGGLCPPLSSPGRLYLATFANLVAERTAVRPNSGFCAAAVYLRQPFNITSASYHQALEHCQAQKPLNTIIIQFPLHTKYIILPLKCAAFNLSKNSGHKKANFRLINKYSNFPHFTFIVQRISFDFLQTLL